MYRAFQAAGVNRVSIGVQRRWCRPCSPRWAVRTSPRTFGWPSPVVREAGIPRVQPRPWSTARRVAGRLADHAAGAIALDPFHISAYALTVEPDATALQPERHPDDDDLADKRAGRRVAHRCRPGQLRGLGEGRMLECRHNILYWQQQGNYRGFGSVAQPPVVVERAHLRAVHRSGCGGREHRGGGRDARCRHSPPGGLPVAIRMTVCRRVHSTPTASTGWSPRVSECD